MILTIEQKELFIKYLQDNITSNEGLMRQMKLINVPRNLYEKYENDTKAFKAVLKFIEDSESVTITQNDIKS